MGHLPKQNSSYMHPNSVLGSTWEAPIVLGKFIGEMASGSGIRLRGCFHGCFRVLLLADKPKE